MPNSSRIVAAAAALALAPALAGCGSCLKKDQRLAVRLVTTDTLNDVGGGAQHVQYRAWAVRDRTVWEAAPAEALASGDVATFAAQGLGTSFPADSSWIRPATESRSFLSVTEDEQFRAVGVAVLYPSPRKALVLVDCKSSAGYREDDDTHTVTFTLDQAEVRPGEPKK
jgi:predicted component of type VI protein secretion system